MNVPSTHDLIHRFIQYLSSEKNASPHTCRNYSKDLEEFENFIGGAKGGDGDIAKVDRMAMRKYLSFLHRKNKKSSIARKLSTLRSFFKYLVKEQILALNPAKSVATPKVEKPLPSTLTVDETFRLMGSADGTKKQGLRDRAILELL
jgi:integrase/recombinase XerC